jgi:hypothetical protein
MPAIQMQHNIGAYLRSEPLFLSSQLITFSSDGNTEVVGRHVDRLALGRAYLSAKICAPFLANTQTSLGVTGILRIEHATSTATGDFSNLATFSTTAGVTKTVATTTTATSTAWSGSLEWDVDLRTARRFIRVGLTMKTGASSSGSVSYMPVAIFGGADELPGVAPVGRLQ